MIDFPSPREVISEMLASRNAKGRSFHLTYDSEPKVDGMSGGIVYIGTVPQSVGSGATDGAAIVVTKTRRNSTIGGATIYSVSMGSGDSDIAEEGLTSVYVIPITTDGEDIRDMVCYADPTDDSDSDDSDIEPYIPKEDSDSASSSEYSGDTESDSAPSSEYSGDTESDDYSHPDPHDNDSPSNSESGSETSVDYCKCNTKQYERDCDRIEREIDELSRELEEIGIAFPTEWQEFPSGGKIYHRKGDSEHLAGTGGSDCPLCNPGGNV